MKYNYSSTKGFSLIELMIVIAIIGILVAVALPQFAAMTEDAKKTKAKQDCDTIAQAIQKFNSLEGSTVSNLMDLKGKYLTNIDTLKDPWGNAYTMSATKGIVYSKGANGKDEKGTKDDIFVNYIGALTLVDAKIEVNPEGGNVSDTADAAKTYDVLHLYFNKPVAIPATVNLADATNAPQGAVSTQDTGANGKTFRYFEGGANKLVDAPTGLPTAVVRCGPETVRASSGAGNVSYGADSKEVIIRFPDGKTAIITPGTHYINLTGAKNTPNPTFKEVADTTTTADAWYGGTPAAGAPTAQAAGTAVLIKNMD